MKTWPLLILAPLMPVFTLLVLHSVWWTFLFYHLGVCVLLPLAHSLGTGAGWRGHAHRVGLTGYRVDSSRTGLAGRQVDASPAGPVTGEADRSRTGLAPGAAVGIVLGLVLGGGTVAVFALWHDAFLSGQDIPAILGSWGVSPNRASLMLAFMVVGNGACEELFWRGWLHHRLASRPRRGMVLAVTAAAYTSYHAVTVASFTGSWPVVVLFLAAIFGAGLFFGWLRERFGTVWAPLLAHTGATAGYMAVYLLWAAPA